MITDKQHQRLLAAIGDDLWINVSRKKAPRTGIAVDDFYSQEDAADDAYEYSQQYLATVFINAVVFITLHHLEERGRDQADERRAEDGYDDQVRGDFNRLTGTY
jgi:hypothetical protein